MKAKHVVAGVWFVLGIAAGCQGNDDVSGVNAAQANSPDRGPDLELIARAAWRHHGTGGQLGGATGPGGTTGAAGSSGSAGASGTGGSSGTSGTAGNPDSTGFGGSTGSAGTIGATTGTTGSTGTTATGSTATGSTVTGSTTGASTAGKVARPSYNTGKGFFVLNGKLYDPNGVEFRVRGVNKLHWDFYTPGIPATHANTERWDIDFTQPTATNIALMQTSIASHMVPMPGNWTGTCSTDSAVLSSIVDTWVAQESAWHAVDDQMIINVANEWGPEASTGTGWRDAYITAVARLRAAGYLATISITSGGCGQDNADLAQYAQAVFDSDPQKNIIFDQHVYGNFSDPATLSWQQDFLTGMTALQATGLAIILGEFGPGRDIGPSPTMITPDQVIQAAEAHNLGWIAWAWDDNPAAGDTWFALSNTGAYASTADLTTFGKVVVENPTYGLLALARANTAF
jgi:mannan endo-1,4-beta-mannosidase